MAALTSDRLVHNPVTGQELFSDHPLAAAETVIYANSLVAVDANGDIAPADDDDAGKVILYADQHFEADSENLNYFTDEARARVQYNVLARLVSTGLGQDDVGKRVYADDDQTVSLSADETAETRAYVGTIRQVVSATECIVYIPGFLQPNVAFSAT